MKRFLSFLSLLLFTIACTVEPQVEPEISAGGIPVPYTVSAQLDDSESRATLSGLSVLWEENDKIAVYDGYGIREFSLVSGAGTKNAVFSGEISSMATDLTAVYPYSAAILEGGEISLQAPLEQNVGDRNVDPDALLMKAVAKKGETLSFRNQLAMLRFQVPSGVTEFVVIPGEGSQIHAVLPGVAGTYEVAIAPGTYNGLSVFCLSGGKWFMKSTDKTITAERNHILGLGELPLENEAVLIRSVADFLSFLSSGDSTSQVTAILLNDIDLQGRSHASRTDFHGVFDGKGHTVSGLNSDAPLFLENNGTLKDFTLTGDCAISSLVFSPLVMDNKGEIDNVRSEVSVSLTTSEAVASAIVIGGIAAYSYGGIDNCVNAGDILFNSSSSIQALAIGGIAGYSEAAISNSRNTGRLACEASFGSGTAALGQISASASNMGGIMGAAYTNAPLSNCINEGEVFFSLSAIDQAEKNYERIQIGGVAGSPYGDIDNCSNTGSVVVYAHTASGTAFNTYSCILDVGGISGGSYTQNLLYTSENDNTSISNCVNSGPIKVEIDSNRSNSPIGGIAGWPNGEHKTIKNKISNCSNSGPITMNGKGKIRIGGVVGGTGFTENCSNTASITVTDADAASVIGGICGFHSQDHGLYACTNTGDVVSKVGIAGAAGLIGNHGNVTLSCAAGCKVNCLVKNVDAERSGTGIVVGKYNGTSGAVTLGSEAEPIEVEGTISFASSETVIDSSNYTIYLAGTSNPTASHVIYAFCNVAPTNLYYAEGTVKYDDGAAAAGVTVSDGFRVAVTDNNGHYTLPTTSDTRYIYVSYPSDAVIEKHSDGTPAFFTKYSYPTTQYDFTFTRQAVENEFVIFAMADPQSHYAKRGNQKTPDTYRFRDEAVPAINGQIAAQSLPCYGVTLGDIVYSESSRNSNSGMTTMRSYFKKLNMPVFQTMGNHDFTYFYSSTPLTTNSTSSTLYLAAQRKFEDTFGPINLSFNRGNVHFVCMRNIIFDSNTDASSYHGGFTDEQYSWFQQDLANVPKSKMVVLCVHIPFVGILPNEHVKDVLNLMKQYASAKVFSGHTHYKRYYSNLNSTGIAEHIHSAVCGQWWWSNIEGDGCPNGYTVYKFSGTAITDEYFIGQNDQMNTRDYQMRIYRGNLKTGGGYAYFQWPHDSKKLMINIFNGDSRWTVKVYENGTFSGNASLMSNSKQTFSSVTAGETYTVSKSSNQDWWAIGYHIGVRGRGTSNSTSYYTNMFHMYTYTLKDANSSVKVVATDGYGNSYECTDVISEDCWYPDYVKGVNAL